MAAELKVCVECGESFELLPNKPGFANKCPACSPWPRLTPDEARQAELQRKAQLADALFKNKIAEKRSAERLGQKDKAMELEDEIQQLGKARISMPVRREPSTR